MSRKKDSDMFPEKIQETIAEMSQNKIALNNWVLTHNSKNNFLPNINSCI